MKKKVYADAFSTYLKDVEENLEKENDAVLCNRLIHGLNEYLANSAKKSGDSVQIENAQKFKTLAEQLIIKKLQYRLDKDFENSQIGYLVIALVGHGSSILQAQKSVARWLKKSEKTVRSGYEAIEDRKEYETQEPIFLIRTCGFQLANLLLAHDRLNFPNGPGAIAKTHKAFQSLCKQLKDCLQNDKAWRFSEHDQNLIATL